MEGQITIPLGYVISSFGALVAALVAMFWLIQKQNKNHNKEVKELTKDFVSSTKDHSKAVENNTRVIEKLPEQIMLQIKATTRL